MKRKLFFWLESLKITRAERNAVTFLMAVLLVIVTVKNLIPLSAPYDDAYYASLEAEFKKRTEIMRAKESAILGRYQPDLKELSLASTFVDTLPVDSLKAEVAESENLNTQPQTAKVNINTADAKTLESLPGIGPAYAARIMEYRIKNGSFASYDDLLKIKGIGKKRLEKLLPFIQLKDPIENK